MDIGVMGGVIRQEGDSRPLEALYREAIEDATRAEEEGFDSFYVSEHHFMDSQWNPSPLMLLSAIASRTSSIRLSQCILQTPFYEPLRLAEDLATLDLISGGRLSLVCGTASITSEFETYDIPVRERHGRTFETMALIKEVYARDVYDHEGRYFRRPGVRMTTRPVQQPFPIWFGGFGPKNLYRAGRLGFHLQVSGVAVPMVSHWEAGLRDGGHDPDKADLGIFLDISVARDPAEAEDMRERKQAFNAAFVAEYKAERDLPWENLDPWKEAAESGHLTSPLNGFVGTPDQILEAFEPVLGGSRITHFVIGVDRLNAMKLGRRP
jgi:alkanesulfonate monooxygenase SsuD/methylene tetrahydromethanopterin reductase-like flavin-dependent oxidoreductase (luciferase family)